MGDKVTDSQAADLLALLRTDISVDTKVAQITAVKSAIKQNNVPESSIAMVFEICRIALVSQHAALVNAGFTTLNHLLTRLSIQDPKYITKEAKHTLPLVLEKVGDAKEKYRLLATHCLTTFWRAASPDVERAVKNTVMVGKNPRAKETSMQWLVQMHEEYGLQFRVFVPTLMELLEDADGMVRDVARNTVIELFRSAPHAAKSDLKRQLKAFNVRATIVSAIMSQLGPGGPVEPEPIEQENVMPQLRNHQSESAVSHSSVARPTTPLPERKIEHVEPLYVDTQRELEDTFRDMYPFFEGKESEQNWLKREQSCTKIRRLNAGNAPSDFHDAWLAGIKGLLDGILKAVNSLRTSLSKEGCSVIQEIARTSGPGLDSMVEILLQNLIKLCGGTKKIASAAGDATVDVIISNVSYSTRILQHIWLACQDKNVQPRTYAAGWLKTLLKKESHHKNHVEHTGGLELIEKCIKKGLADPNPGVREKMRGTFWVFAKMWPSRGDALMATLDPAQLKLLQHDPGNPNSPKKAEPVVRPGLGFSKSTTGPPKPSLRETMLAQKKAAMAAKNLPLRPGSAMSSFSPVKTASSSSMSSTASQSTGSRARPEPTTSVSHGGLSVAPMRPTKYRPKDVARPATAGPYSVRQQPVMNHGAPTTGVSASTPSTSRLKTRTPSTILPSPKRTVPRPNTSHANHASQSSIPSPKRESPTRDSPRRETPAAIQTVSSPQQVSQQITEMRSIDNITPEQSPAVRPRTADSYRAMTPSKDDEEFTMVMPNFAALPAQSAAAPSPSPSARLTTPMKALRVFEDPFSVNDDNTTPRPILSTSVLEEVPINEDVSNIVRPTLDSNNLSKGAPHTPERVKEDSEALESGIRRVKAQTLDGTGLRKVQGILRNGSKSLRDGQNFDELLVGLFHYLASPLSSLEPAKAQDRKVQILATIKLMLRRDREAFSAHVAEGLDCLLVARACHEDRAHIVQSLELLANDLLVLGDAGEMETTITSRLEKVEMTEEGGRTLNMGLHMLKELLVSTPSFILTGNRAEHIARLALKCVNSTLPGPRRIAAVVCVALHTRLGEEGFWALPSVSGTDHACKNFLTYLIVSKKEVGLAR